MEILRTVLEEKNPDTGAPTGKLSTSRVLAWVFAVLSALVVSFELGVAVIGEFWSDKCDGELFGLKSAVMYGVGLGVVAAGFAAGKAGGLFDRIADRLTGSGS
jgi:hypothetical protein